MEKYDSLKDTIQHIFNVQKIGNTFLNDMQNRFTVHDRGKTEYPEKEIFDEFTPKLKGTIYGSEEYNLHLKDMGHGLEHHYKNNRHHPEYHMNGISDMNIMDISEMLIDWIAASERHDDGNIGKSIELNSKRFGYKHELKRVLINTVMGLYKYSVDISISDGRTGLYYGNSIYDFHKSIEKDNSMADLHDILKNGYYENFKRLDGSYEYKDHFETIDNCVSIRWKIKYDEI